MSRNRKGRSRSPSRAGGSSKHGGKKNSVWQHALRVECELLEERRLLSIESGTHQSAGAYSMFGAEPYQRYDYVNGQAAPVNADACNSSENPVRYLDGMANINVTDLSSSGFGAPWSHTRTWAPYVEPVPDQTTPPDASRNFYPPHGKHWEVAEIRLLLSMASEDGPQTIMALDTGLMQRYFDWDGAHWVSRAHQQGNLTYTQVTGGQGYFTMKMPDGGRVRYYDFLLTTPYKRRGRFMDYTHPGGAVTTAHYYTSGPNTDLLQEIRREEAGAKESFFYSYDGIGRITEIEWKQRKTLTGPDSAIRRVRYVYYANKTNPVRQEEGGTDGDLKMVQTLAPTGELSLTSLTRPTPPAPGTKALATTAAPHNYMTGDTVVIAGASPSEFNGTFQINVTGSNTFEYAIANGTGDSAAGATVNKPIDIRYYRYWQYHEAPTTEEALPDAHLPDDDTGIFGAIQMVFGPQAVARLEQAFPHDTSNPNNTGYFNVSDGAVLPYADNYYSYLKYEGPHIDKWRVVKEIAQGEGCSCGDNAGGGRFLYQYPSHPTQENKVTPPADPHPEEMRDYNVWRHKVVEIVPDTDDDYLPDNDRTVIYLNEVGDPMLKVFLEGQEKGYSGPMWFEYSRYDNAGRIVLKAGTSAIIPPSPTTDADGHLYPLGGFEQYPDLMGRQSDGSYLYLANNAGQIERINYSGWTFDERSGIAASGSSVLSPTPPQLDQVAVLKNGGTASLNVAGWEAADYDITYSAATTLGGNLKLWVDGKHVYTDNASATPALVNAFGDRVVRVTIPSAGDHTILFEAENLGVDPPHKIYVDNVRITRVSTGGSLAVENAGFELPDLGNAAASYRFNPTEYAMSAGAATPGSVAGLLRDSKVQQGEFGVPIVQSARTYYERTAGGVSVYPIAEEKVYPTGDALAPQTTLYTYQWYEGLTLPISRSASYPQVDTANNGPGMAGPDVERVVYDKYGRIVWGIDGEEYVSQAGYDMLSGATGSTVTDSDTPYLANVMADGPAAYWRLAATPGAEVLYGRNLSMFESNPPSYTAGVDGALLGDSDKAVDFNGSSGYASMGDGSGTLRITGDVSIEAWVLMDAPPAAGSYALIASRGGGAVETEPGNTDWGIGISNVGGSIYLAAFHESGAGVDTTALDVTRTVPTGTWQHVAVVRNAQAKSYTFYLNGVAATPVGYSTNPTGGDATSAAVNIGREHTGLYYFNGKIDELAIYRYGLGAQRVAAHYSAGRGTVAARTGLGLSTSTEVDGLGRPIKLTDPAGNVTYTVYKDHDHEVRTYRWNTGTGTPTGAVEVTREHRPDGGRAAAEATGSATDNGNATTLVDTARSEASGSFVGYELAITSGAAAGQRSFVTDFDNASKTFTVFPPFTTAPASGNAYELRPLSDAFLYFETLASSAAPTAPGGRPDGGEVIELGNILSLRREFTNRGGQVIASDEYVALPQGTLNSGWVRADAAGMPLDLGTPGTHYHRTQFGYDSRGRQSRVKDPTGTITRTGYDSRGRVESTWIGINDGPSNVTKKFDFGTGGATPSPLASGYQQATDAAFDSSAGFGWTAGVRTAVDRRDPSDNSLPLERDLVYASDATFEVSVPDGDYDVTVWLGDEAVNHDQQTVYLEGRLAYFYDDDPEIPASSVRFAVTSPPSFIQKKYPVTVTDGRLTLRIKDNGGTDANVGLIGLEVVPVAFWRATNNPGTNMLMVSKNEYDGGGAGDGNLTKVTRFPTGEANLTDVSSPSDDRVTRNYYDWRNRLVATKEGDQGETLDSGENRPLIYRQLDNLGRVTQLYQYDGDGVQLATTNGVPVKPNADKLRALTRSDYDERGRLFRTTTFSVNPVSGGDPTAGLTDVQIATLPALRNDTWYNRRGGVAKTREPGGVVRKHEYDGAGRQVKGYVSDGGGDSAWAHALNVTDDTVLEQTETQYDGSGNAIFTVLRQRFHNTPGNGPLGAPSNPSNAARVSYSGAWFDLANRMTASVDWGTNGGTAMSQRPTDVPDRATSQALRTDYGYTADEVQLISITGTPTAGTFTLKVDGTSTPTGSIAYNATRADVQTALQSLAAIGSGNAVVIGRDGGPWTVRFVGAKAGQNVPYLVVESNSISGGSAEVVTTSQGGDSGRVQKVSHPREISAGTPIVSKTDYDLLGRTLRQTEGYVDFLPAADDDQITDFTYDGAAHVLTRTAAVAPNAFQTTQYVYGVTTADGSNLHSNQLLAEVRYPDTATGKPGTATSDKQVFAYNALGEKVKLTDQNGTVHEYDYDLMGRERRDRVTSFPASVDGTIRRLETEYDSAGRVWKLTSYDDATPGAPDTFVNQVKREYNGLGQMSAEYQSHAGEVGAGTPAVRYTYEEMAGGVNNSRVKSLTYPNGRKIWHEYNAGTDNAVSRLSYLADNLGGPVSTHLEEYTYLGLGTIVERNRPEPGTKLTYIAQGTGDQPATAGDQYRGLDGFGRVVDQRWRKATAGTPELDRFVYTYDRSSNRTSKDNISGSGNPGPFDEAYLYDRLDRLTKVNRGALTGGTIEDGAAGYRQTWSMDALGNWGVFVTDSDGGDPSDPSGVTTQNRTHNARNQITGGAGTASPVHDANGNMTVDETGKRFVYDAWNRLKKVRNAADTADVAVYQYDALNRRVVEQPVPGSARDLYYSDDWQVLEERENGVVLYQNVWGQGYVDALVLRDAGLDNAFSGDGKLVDTVTGTAYAVLVQPDGKILAGGVNTATNRYSLIRYNPDGSRDTTFSGDGLVEGSTTGAGLYGMALQSDGKIVAVGYSGSDFLLIRLNSNGTLDTSFDGDGLRTQNFGATDVAHAVAIQSDGKIVAVGKSNNDFAVARFNTNGSLNIYFDTDGTTDLSSGGADQANDVAIDANGKIVVGGTAGFAGGTRFAAARYNTNGSLDTSFHSDGKVDVQVTNNWSQGEALAIDGSGNILLGGWGSDSVIGLPFAIARLTPSGALDTAFDGDGIVVTSFGSAGTFDAFAWDMALMPNGRIVAVGQYGDAFDVDYKFAAARYHTDGSLDTSFDGDGRQILDINADFDDIAYATAVEPGGRIIIAGTSNGSFALVRMGERLYAQQDANWNVTSITDAAGAVRERYLYGPYGQVSYKAAAWSNLGSSGYSWNYLHQGGRYDNSSTLYHFRNRDYSPTLGRWLRTDPLGYVDGSNVYLYVLANPAGNRDPSGHISLSNLSVTAVLGAATVSGLASGASSAYQTLDNPQCGIGAVAGSFADGFARGFLSGAITSGLVVYSRGSVPLPLANAIGNFVGNILVDFVRIAALEDETLEDLKPAMLNAGISALWGVFAGMTWGKVTPSAQTIKDMQMQYAQQMDKAIKLRIEPRGLRWPVEPSRELLEESFGKGVQQQAAVEAQFKAFKWKLLGGLSLDAFLSNGAPSGFASAYNAGETFLNFMRQREDAANRRVYGDE